MKSMKTTLFTTLLLVFIMILASCNGNKTADDDLSALVDELNEENEELEEEIDDLEDQIANLSSSDHSNGDAAPMAETSYAIGINALLYIEGEDAATAADEIGFTGSVTIAAMLDAPEGKVLNYWMVNNEMTDSETLVFDVADNTVIQAVLRDPLKITTINADLQLLDSNNDPQGDKMREYVFEDEKTISIYVVADVPSGYEMSHWIINGSPYFFNRVVSNFRVLDLDRTITYEAAFKKKPAPVEMVTVTCINATFTGGGYVDASSGEVPKGATITVTGTHDVGSPNFWKINGSDDFSKGKSFTYKVNKNTSFEYTGYN